MEKEKHTDVLESLFDKTTDYLETRAQLVKLKAVRKTSELVSGLVTRLVIFALLGIFLMVFNIALGLWLGEMMNKEYYGFFTLAGFYLLLGIIFYACRKKWLKAPIADAIIKKINS